MEPNARSIVSAPRHRFAILAASLVALHVAGAAPAFAQDAPPPAGGAPPPAAAAPSADDQKKAIELFKKGQALQKSNKCGEALPILRESYTIIPSPNSRLVIARCLSATNDHVGAYAEFEAIIADVDARGDPKYQQARDAAVLERDEAAKQIAVLTVSVANAKDGTRLSVGGKDVPRERWGKGIPLAPGPVEVSLTTPPAPPVSQQIDLHAGDKQPLNLDAGATSAPPPLPPTTTGNSRAMLRPIAYVAGGIGVAGVLMFAIGGGLANATYSDLDAKCSKGTGARACPSDTQSQIDSGNVQKDVANAGLVIGVAGLAAGVTFFLLSRDTGPKKEAAPEVTAVVGPQYLGLQGTF